MHAETSKTGDSSVSALSVAAPQGDATHAAGFYHVECRAPDGRLKWAAPIQNAVMQEGKVVALNALFKSSGFTQLAYLGLIASTGYVSAPVAANTAAKLATTASANGWNEVDASVVAARGTPSWGAAAGANGNASLANSTPVSFTALAPATIKGCFVLLKDLAGVAPSNVVGAVTGALYSAGLFTDGDKQVGTGDALTVTYTATMV